METVRYSGISFSYSRLLPILLFRHGKPHNVAAGERVATLKPQTKFLNIRDIGRLRGQYNN